MAAMAMANGAKSCTAYANNVILTLDLGKAHTHTQREEEERKGERERERQEESEHTECGEKMPLDNGHRGM